MEDLNPKMGQRPKARAQSAQRSVTARINDNKGRHGAGESTRSRVYKYKVTARRGKSAEPVSNPRGVTRDSPKRSDRVPTAKVTEAKHDAAEAKAQRELKSMLRRSKLEADVARSAQEAKEPKAPNLLLLGSRFLQVQEAMLGVFDDRQDADTYRSMSDTAKREYLADELVQRWLDGTKAEKSALHMKWSNAVTLWLSGVKSDLN